MDRLSSPVAGHLERKASPPWGRDNAMMSDIFKQRRSARQRPLSVRLATSWIPWHAKWTQSDSFIRANASSIAPVEDSRRVVRAEGEFLIMALMFVGHLQSPIVTASHCDAGGDEVAT